MKFYKIIILLLILNSCVTDDFTKQVIMGNSIGIKNRSDAVNYYIDKRILNTIDFNDSMLYIFDCSADNWISDEEMKYIVFFRN